MRSFWSRSESTSPLLKKTGDSQRTLPVSRRRAASTQCGSPALGPPPGPVEIGVELRSPPASAISTPCARSASSRWASSISGLCQKGVADRWPTNPQHYSHQEWLGYVQPVGVVVSTPALVEAGAAINRNFVPLHREFLAVLPQDADGNADSQADRLPKISRQNVLKLAAERSSAPDESLTISVPAMTNSFIRTTSSRTADTPILLICKPVLISILCPAPSRAAGTHRPRSL
jgi:hypothetical protein